MKGYCIHYSLFVRELAHTIGVTVTIWTTTIWTIWDDVQGSCQPGDCCIQNPSTYAIPEPLERHLCWEQLRSLGFIGPNHVCPVVRASLHTQLFLHRLIHRTRKTMNLGRNALMQTDGSSITGYECCGTRASLQVAHSGLQLYTINHIIYLKYPQHVLVPMGLHISPPSSGSPKDPHCCNVVPLRTC